MVSDGRPCEKVTKPSKAGPMKNISLFQATILFSSFLFGIESSGVKTRSMEKQHIHQKYNGILVPYRSLHTNNRQKEDRSSPHCVADHILFHMCDPKKTEKHLQDCTTHPKSEVLTQHCNQILAPQISMPPSFSLSISPQSQAFTRKRAHECLSQNSEEKVAPQCHLNIQNVIQDHHPLDQQPSPENTEEPEPQLHLNIQGVIQDHHPLDQPLPENTTASNQHLREENQAIIANTFRITNRRITNPYHRFDIGAVRIMTNPKVIATILTATYLFVDHYTYLRDGGNPSVYSYIKSGFEKIVTYQEIWHNTRSAANTAFGGPQDSLPHYFGFIKSFFTTVSTAYKIFQKIRTFLFPG
jgi:hypothetical protein